MFLVLLIFLAALSLEGIGSFISVIGLSAAFNADPIILTMAVILDFSKIIAVSVLSKRWKQINIAIRGYLVAAMIVLMIITSSGIAGYLSNSFQKALLPNQGNTIVIDNLNKEQTRLEERKKEIDSQIAQLPTNSVRGRRQLMLGFKPETDHINQRLVEIETQLPTLQTKQVTQNTEVGPIIFLAQTLGIAPEKAVSIVIALIIFVFDPLSIIFLITGNRLLVYREEQKFKKEQEALLKSVGLDPRPVEVLEDKSDPRIWRPIEGESEALPVAAYEEPMEEVYEVPAPLTPEDIAANAEVYAPYLEPIPEIGYPEVSLLPTDQPSEPYHFDGPDKFFKLNPDKSESKEEHLEDILKQIVKNKDEPMTEAERERLNKALDRIFATQQEPIGKPEQLSKVEVSAPVEQINPGIPSEPEDETLVDTEEPIPEITTKQALQALISGEDLTVTDFDNTKVITPEPKYQSALDDTNLDRVAGSGFEFVGPHWINPKLMDVYNK